jgi:hypothetical protein
MRVQRQSKPSVFALLRGKCRGSGFALLALALLSAPAGSLATNVRDPVVPDTLDHAELSLGFKVERYSHIWQRNPFTLVAPAAPREQDSPFSKMFLTSWLKDGSQEVVFVQNSDTNVVQRITEQANQNNVRLLELRSNGCEYPRVKVYTLPCHERESPRMPCKTLPGRLYEEQLELKHLDTRLNPP